MAKFFTERDCDPQVVRSQRVGVLGFGNQGAAHAENLRDSGVTVIVGARTGGRGAQMAEDRGFEVRRISDCAEECDVLFFGLPDTQMAEVFASEVVEGLRAGQALVFAHGLAVHAGWVRPPSFVDVLLVAPKGPGARLRSEFEQGSGLIGEIAIAQDASGTAFARALSYAWGIGCARRGLLVTTFEEETVTDLFSEQAVLCGGIPELMRAAFDELVQAGYQPEAAYIECICEAKFICDAIYEVGLAGMMERISDTAAWGGMVAGPEVVGEDSRAAMKRLLQAIRDGAFADELAAAMRDGGGRLAEFRARSRKSLVEETFRRLGEACPMPKPN
jgi:ketol-acid reductoisomerase